MMRFRHRRSEEAHESESYYISMTDLMVGVLFIFIIMLAYFALNFRDTTSELTRAKDPQTTALLKVATDLKPLNATIEVDRQSRVVCVPESDLLGTGGGIERRCFAYSGAPPADQASDSQKRSAASLALFASDLDNDLASSAPLAQVSLSDAATSFDAEKIFQTGSSEFTPEGRAAVSSLANVLANRLPCLSYGVAGQNCRNDGKLDAVVVLGTADTNMFTETGRAEQALSVERSVAFHQALVRAQPQLAQLRNQADGGAPLLRVVSVGNSSVTAPSGGAGKAIVIQFHMKSE